MRLLAHNHHFNNGGMHVAMKLQLRVESTPVVKTPINNIRCCHIVDKVSNKFAKTTKFYIAKMVLSITE